MYNIIQHSHSGIMWLVVVTLLLSIILSLVSFVKKDQANPPRWNKLFFYTKWLMYIQALLGIVLIFISPKVQYSAGFMKNEFLRFYGMEHPLMMIISIGLVSMGLFFTKKKRNGVQKNRTIFIYYTIALVILMMMVPWKTVLA